MTEFVVRKAQGQGRPWRVHVHVSAGNLWYSQQEPDSIVSSHETWHEAISEAWRQVWVDLTPRDALMHLMSAEVGLTAVNVADVAGVILQHEGTHHLIFDPTNTLANAIQVAHAQDLARRRKGEL